MNNKNHGKNVRLYLPDGTGTGLRFAEIVNWTGQALACPRHRIAELDVWEELKRPGVYFLFGTEEENRKTYIGEAENVTLRLKQQLKNKDFWQECVAITNKDDNMTKAHVKYLESRLIAMARDNGRCQLDNKEAPPAPSLPRGDQASQEAFLDFIRILLPVLGHRLLEPLPASEEIEEKTNASNSFIKLVMNLKGLQAYGAQTDDGFMVFKGSQVWPKPTESVPEHVEKRRTKARQDGLLIEQDGCWVLTRDYRFDSPSGAAAFIAGASRNGRRYWRYPDGRSIKEVEEALAGDA